MSDSAEARMLVRLQSVGSNVNTWGGYVNDNFEITGRHNKGYQALVVTGDATVSWTNYSKVNDGQAATLKLTGALSASATLTFGNRENQLTIYNTTGSAITIKCMAGIGVSIPNGYIAQVYCDGTDYYNAAPQIFIGAITVAGQIHGVTAGTATTDAVNLTQMSTAIATAGLPATSGTLLNSVNDTTAGYLSQKVTATLGGLTTTQVAGLTSIQTSTVHAAGNEQTLITIGAGYVGGFLNGGYQNAQFTPVVGNGYDVDCTASGVTVNLTGMTTPQLGQKIELNKYGAYNMFLLGTVNGGSNFFVAGNGTTIYRYSGSTWGWN